MVNPIPPSLDEIRAERKAIAARDRVLSDLERAILNWANYEGASTEQPEIQQALQKTSHVEKTVQLTEKRKKTRKDLIIEALNSPRPLWQSAKDIRGHIQREFQVNIPMVSISPTLTELKLSGTILRNEMKVALALRVEKEEKSFQNENGPPEGDPEAGDFAESPN
jgi:hypothetical protein